MRGQTKKLTFTALFAALIFVATMTFKLPLRPGGGYVHIGDAFIFLAACMLPMPYAMAASAVGAALSDAVVAPIYILPTLLIKPLLVLPFTAKSERMITAHNVLAVVAASVIGLAGYFLADIFFVGVKAAAFNALFGATQPLASAVVFVVAGYAFDRLGVKKAMGLE